MESYHEEILDVEFKEENSSKNNLTNRFGIFLAKWSFIFGTFLFALAFITQFNDGVIILGAFYNVIVFVMNLMFFLFLCVKQGTPEEQESYRRTAGIMTLNIPIALIYMKIISPYL